mgnify:FL=1
MEIITGRERRRQWSDEDKLRILEEASDPRLSAAAVARRHDLLPQQIYKWRRQFRHPASSEEASFLPVELIADGTAPKKAKPRRSQADRIEIGLKNGRTLRVGADLDADCLRSLIRVVEEA